MGEYPYAQKRWREAACWDGPVFAVESFGIAGLEKQFDTRSVSSVAHLHRFQVRAKAISVRAAAEGDEGFGPFLCGRMR